MDSARKRGNPATALSGLDLADIKRAGELTEAQLTSLTPYFEELKRVIHEKWETCSLSDGQTAKTLHFQLRAVNSLQKLMYSKTVKGKQATKKLEEINRE